MFDFLEKLKKLAKKDDNGKGEEEKEDNQLIKKIADIEKGDISDEEFKSIVKKLSKAGVSKNKLKELTKRFKEVKKAQKEKDTVKEGKLSRFLGGLALSAAALGAIGSIN